MGFLANQALRPLTLAPGSSVTARGLALGKGANALEVAIAESQSPVSAGGLRSLWKARLAGRATPLLLVVLYDGKAALCGPGGEQPAVFADLKPDVVERICRTALDEPDRHAALRFLRSVIPQLEPDIRVPGLRNEGLFSTYELQAGVPRRKDWPEAVRSAKAALQLRGKALVEALGFSLAALPGDAYILRAADTKLAVAVFLDRRESPDAPNTRYGSLSAVSYALAQAERENLDYVLVSAGSTLRLYPVRTGAGPGQRGRTETFVEIHLDILPESDAGYLWLIFSAGALRKAGTIGEVLDASKRYAADLGARLRDRVYVEVVPRLAQALLRARGLRAPSARDLAETYEMALLVLFRLLFVAYAEDKDLLPYRTNSLYRDRSLKQKANDLIALRKAGTQFGKDSIHWEEVDRLFRAVDKGNAEWAVPPYNGGLFSCDATASTHGARLAEVRLPDYEFGPVLQSLLVDNTPEGWGPVDFRSLGVREFGTIYEGLLENELAIADADLTTEVSEKQEQYRPAKAGEDIKVPKGHAYLHNRSGQRKATGTFFYQRLCRGASARPRARTSPERPLCTARRALGSRSRRGVLRFSRCRYRHGLGAFPGGGGGSHRARAFELPGQTTAARGSG